MATATTFVSHLFQGNMNDSSSSNSIEKITFDGWHSISKRLLLSRSFGKDVVAAAADGSSNSSSSSSSDNGEIFYMVIFGVMANLMIVAACLTTMAFVRRRTPSTSSSSAFSSSSNQVVTPEVIENGIKNSSCEKDKKTPPCQLEGHHVPKNVSLDAYKLLAGYPLSSSGQQHQQQQPHIIHHQQQQHKKGATASFIPEVYASKNMDVQAMLISSANVNQFFPAASAATKVNHPPQTMRIMTQQQKQHFSQVAAGKICWTLN